MGHVGGLGGRQGIELRLIIDRPGVLRSAGARGHAGDERIEAFAAKAVAGKRERIAGVDLAYRCASQLLNDICRRGTAGLPPDETDDVVAEIDQRPHGRSADRPRRAENHHAPRGERPVCRHYDHALVKLAIGERNITSMSVAEMAAGVNGSMG